MSDAMTILDYLNEDCWRAVLRLVSVSDVIRTERVSRRWQHVVLTYLSNVRIGIGKSGKDFYYNDHIEIPTMTIGNVQWLPLPLREAWGSFENWTYKMGESVVAAYCDESIFDIIGENCPNLKEAMFINLPEKLLMDSQHENFKRLRRLYIIRCHVPDHVVYQFITSNVLEHLEIDGNSRVEGRCLINLTTKLKSLVIRNCRPLLCSHLLAASDNFGRLKKLVLRGISKEWDDFQVLLTKTPKLEHLEVDDGDMGFSIKNLFSSICQLRSLKNLSLEAFVKNEDLDTLTRCCPELECMKLTRCVTVTGEGLAAACRNAGSRFVVLGIPGSDITDDDVVACISACPNLRELNVSRSSSLSCELLPRAASARRDMRARRPLRLLVDREFLHDNLACPHEEYSDPLEEFEELDIHPTTPRRRWLPNTMCVQPCVYRPKIQSSCSGIGILDRDDKIDLETLRVNYFIRPRKEKNPIFRNMSKIFCCKRRN